MGYREFWDGQWVWPEGLAHYVEFHDLFLPETFVDHVMENQVPSTLPPPEIHNMDFEFWIDWASTNFVN